jgi:hypothetical protein
MSLNVLLARREMSQRASGEFGSLTGHLWWSSMGTANLDWEDLPSPSMRPKFANIGVDTFAPYIV